MALGSPRVFMFHFRRSMARFGYIRITIALFLLCLVIYPLTPGLPSPSINIPDAFSRSASSSKQSAARPLWHYITEYVQQAELRRNMQVEDGELVVGEPPLSPNSTGGWEWARSVKRSSAPSAGGLSGEGAKASFRTNLRRDKNYFLGFKSAGWNNQVMDTMNVIYFSTLLNRIPILPPFESNSVHMHAPVGTLAVSEVFDLSYVSSVLGNLPIIEAHELKLGTERQSPRLKYVKRARPAGSSYSRNSQPTEYIKAVEPVDDEEIGCWRFKGPNPYPWLPFARLTGYYTPIPRSVLYKDDFEHPSMQLTADVFKNYHGKVPQESLDLLKGIPEKLAPEEHVACLDFSYFLQTKPEVGGLHDEWRAGEGVWHLVGQYMRYTPELLRITEDFVKEQLGLDLDGPKPVYMAVHIRRGDFGNWFKQFSPRHWAYKVSQVLNEVRDRTGETIEHVIVTTDEQDEEWLNGLRSYGLSVIDHQANRTGDRLDHWFPTVIDSIILASAKAFIGIGASTMSILAMRRVIDWNAGIAYLLHDPNMKVPEGWSWHLDNFVKGDI